MQMRFVPGRNFINRTSVAVVGVTAAVLFLYFVSSAKAATNPADFVHKASIGGLFEIESSKVALQRSKNDQIKKFAQKMVEDHGQASKDLDSVLSKSTVDAASEAKDLDPEHARILESLQNTADADFDRAYVKAQRDAHDEAVPLFRSYASSGTDDILKAFARRTLPTLEHHQKMADSLNSAMIKTGSSGQETERR